MLQLRHGAALPMKPGGDRRVAGEFGMECLDRNLAQGAAHALLGFVNHAHSPLTNDACHSVAAANDLSYHRIVICHLGG